MYLGPSKAIPKGRTSRFQNPTPLSLKRVARNPGVIAVVLAAVFLSMLPLRDSEAVINGPVVASAPSWATFLVHRSDSSFEMCSGALVSANLVLSAKHCSAKNIDTAMIGNANLNVAGGAQRALGTFEGYPGDDDLGVFVLDQPVDQKPIALSTQDIHLNPEVVTFFGYGLNSEIEDMQDDFRLHSVKGMSVGCLDDFVDEATEWEFCLRSQTANQAPCHGDSGGPIVTQGGALGAVYVGFRDSPENPRCEGSLWRAVSVTPDPVRTWVAEMIDKYEVNDEL